MNHSKFSDFMIYINGRTSVITCSVDMTIHELCQDLIRNKLAPSGHKLTYGFGWIQNTKLTISNFDNTIPFNITHGLLGGSPGQGVTPLITTWSHCTNCSGHTPTT